MVKALSRKLQKEVVTLKINIQTKEALEIE